MVVAPFAGVGGEDEQLRQLSSQRHALAPIAAVVGHCLQRWNEQPFD